MEPSKALSDAEKLRELARWIQGRINESDHNYDDEEMIDSYRLNAMGMSEAFTEVLEKLKELGIDRE